MVCLGNRKEEELKLSECGFGRRRSIVQKSIPVLFIYYSSILKKCNKNGFALNYQKSICNVKRPTTERVQFYKNFVNRILIESPVYMLLIIQNIRFHFCALTSDKKFLQNLEKKLKFLFTNFYSPTQKSRYQISYSPSWF